MNMNEFINGMFQNNKNISDLIPLDKMKCIMNEAIDNADTLGDFYSSLLVKIYNLGYEQGLLSMDKEKTFHVPDYV